MAHCENCKNPQNVGKVKICECGCVACRNSTLDDLAQLAKQHDEAVATLRTDYERALNNK